MAEFNTNPGDRSVTELEREVDRERERVSATIDELQSRASMGNIVDQLVKAVGENGGDISRNVGRSLRENPMAALLTGVGLAWLMAGSSRRHGKGWWLGFGRPALPSRHRPGFADFRRFGRSDRRRRVGTVWRALTEAPAPSGEGLGQRAAEAAGRIGEGVSETVAGLKDRAADFAHAAGSRLGQAGDAVRGVGSTARHHAGAARRGAAGASSDMRQGLDSFMEEQPLVLGAIAMALGAAVGGALPRSRIEDRVFGEQSDRAMETVRTLAKDQGAKAQVAASAVVDEALNIVDEASAELGAKLPSGEEIVDAAESKVRDAASRLREASGVNTSKEPSGVEAIQSPGDRPVG